MTNSFARSGWSGGSAPADDAEQLRARAGQLEASIHRRNVRDHLSFVLVALVFVFGAVILSSPLTRVGSSCWPPGPCCPSTGCAAMARSRSRPAQPTRGRSSTVTAAARTSARHRALVAMGRRSGYSGRGALQHRIRVGPQADRRSISAALVGVFLFVYIAIVIYGKALAGRWQSEIDELRKLRN